MNITKCNINCDTISRLGGDEFTIILENIEQLKYVADVCERIIETMGKPIR